MAGATFKTLSVLHNNGSGIAAGSDILAAVTVARSGVLHIAISVDTSTSVDLTINDGTTEETIALNGGAALAAGTGYVFTWPALSGYAYSLINNSGGSTSDIQHAAFLLETPVG